MTAPAKLQPADTTIMTSAAILSKLQEMKEQLDDLYEGQEGIKDQLRELALALDMLSAEDEDNMARWGV